MLVLHFCIVSLLISFHDIKTHRIKRHNIYVSSLTLLPLIEITGILFGISNFLLYFAIFYISRKNIGYGDVRLSGLVGLYLGGINGNMIDLATMNCFCWGIAGFWALLRSMQKRERLIERLAFAPFMFAGLALLYIVNEFEGISEILG
jgi:prepilin signal peptidase PulO-like enzyme (type II secretory pathway)